MAETGQGGYKFVTLLRSNVFHFNDFGKLITHLN